jgi:hypothetical protein
MMKQAIKSISTAILLCLAGTGKAQITDSVISFNEPYQLSRITQYNKVTVINESRKELKFILLSQQPLVDHYKQKYRLNAALNDTIISMDWDIEKNTALGRLPDAGLFRMAGNGRIVIRKSRLSDENRRQIVERKFKIFKWNNSALVLQDLNDPDVNRVYTFRR